MTTPAHEEDPFTLLQTFEYNPAFIRPRHGRQPDFYRTLPFDFYDRHMAPSLSLKHVKVDSTIPASLAAAIDATLSDLRSGGYESLPVTSDTVGDFIPPAYQNRVYDTATADSLASRYQITVGQFATAFVSRWVVHPTAPAYYSTLEFSRRRSDLPTYHGEYVHWCHSLRFRPFGVQRVEVMSVISDQLTHALRSLEGKDLVIYQFYTMSAEMEQIFKDMDSLGAFLPSAEYRTSGLVDSKMTPSPRPCDASDAHWSLDHCCVQSTEENAVIQRIGCERVKPRLSDTQTKFDEMDSQTAAGLCYHAWHRAVKEDATIIVFHCGNYERIGIRHRATQTLVLSELIEVSKRQEPAYGKIHMGLMLAAVTDALNRHGQSYHPQPAKVLSTGKRSQACIDDDPNLRRSKRQKAKAQMARLPKTTISLAKDEKIFWIAFSKCSIALVYMNFDSLGSSIPAACLRHGGPLSRYGVESGTSTWQESYEPLECCSLMVDSDLTRGGTGRIHSAKLEIKMADGTTLSKDVIVKTAVDRHLRKRVRREYDTYRHLWEHKVNRIPMVYGLFEDPDDMVTILVIEKFKMTFRDREPLDLEGRGMLLSVTRSERSLCLATVRAMHKAGVAHLDLRAENIMVGNDGLPVIIDFGQSLVGADKEVTDKEIGYFQEVLDGKVRDGFPFEFDSDED
ncbi:hypothetical protein BDN72DRAFT_960747 [Pluteus cervinus]|uniref:Uncharacterized protein n=1 Tax=Pluteus cervinus TaxID=181527 RepID=A0ACD3AQE5_9AGAR|nr:hypothetical protein BDN72DRAFT_960747 [Pluteus cervinus]